LEVFRDLSTTGRIPFEKDTTVSHTIFLLLQVWMRPMINTRGEKRQADNNPVHMTHLTLAEERQSLIEQWKLLKETQRYNISTHYLRAEQLDRNTSEDANILLT
jgi:hypothetical protein